MSAQGVHRHSRAAHQSPAMLSLPRKLFGIHSMPGDEDTHVNKPNRSLQPHRGVTGKMLEDPCNTQHPNPGMRHSGGSRTWGSGQMTHVLRVAAIYSAVTKPGRLLRGAQEPRAALPGGNCPPGGLRLHLGAQQERLMETWQRRKGNNWP